MRFGLAIVALAASCGGHEVSPSGPALRPSVRLVRCQPATPPPVIVSEAASDAVFGTLDARLRPSIGVRPSTAARPGWGKHVPNVEIGTPTISVGDLDGAVIARALRLHIPALRACYETALVTKPTLAGKLTVSFAIDPDGKVMGVSTSGIGAANALSPCLVRAMYALTFPRPTGAGIDTVTFPFAFDTSTRAAPEERIAPEPATDLIGEPWTPFAIDSSPPLDTAPTIARATEGALRARLSAIEACFTGAAPTGSLRAMLELDADGGLTEARIGGLGDRAIEACVAKALDGMHVVTPTADPAEVACDLSRGDAQPWRIAPDAGYQTIEVSRTRLLHGAEVVEPGATEPDPLPAGATYLVIADADAPGTMIELALSWATEGDATLIALRDGARAPALIGAGRSMYSVGDDYDDTDAVRATLKLGAKTVTACVHSTTQDARLGDPAAIGSLLSRVAAKCRKIGCAATLSVAIDGAAVARDLVEVMAAARRAGFERVLIGGFPGCQAPRPDRDDDL